jgi:hypothetical protein
MRQADRLVFVDTFRFPGVLRQRFLFVRETLRTDQFDLVEAAARQWFRLAARHPRAQLSMPSIVVGELVDEFARRGAEYREFCESAFGKMLPHEAGTNALGHTFQLAQKDERTAPPQLPLLFRIDRELGVADGRHYLAACGGGRTVCHELPGAICLQHLNGAPHSRLPWDTRPWTPEPPPPGGELV